MEVWSSGLGALDFFARMLNACTEVVAGLEPLDKSIVVSELLNL